jgi:hypothetical protein
MGDRHHRRDDRRSTDGLRHQKDEVHRWTGDRHHRRDDRLQTGDQPHRSDGRDRLQDGLRRQSGDRPAC